MSEDVELSPLLQNKLDEFEQEWGWREDELRRQKYITVHIGSVAESKLMRDPLPFTEYDSSGINREWFKEAIRRNDGRGVLTAIYYYQGYSIRKIAKLLNVSRQTVHNTIQQFKI